MIKKLIEDFIKILIELSYWNGFFMKWRNKDEVSFGLGVWGMIIMLSINMMTIMMAIQLHTEWKAFDAFDSLLPKYIIQANSRWE